MKHNNFLKKSVEITFNTGIAIGSLLYVYGTFWPSTNLTRHLHDQVQFPEHINYFNTSDSQLKAYEFMGEYKSAIVDSSRKNKIPPEMLGAVLLLENDNRYAVEDLKDFFGKYLGLDVSLGPGQVNLSTAAGLDKTYHRNVKNRSTYKSLLENPQNNIGYIAILLYDLKIRNGYGKMSEDDLLKNPEAFAKVVSGYVNGKSGKETPNLYGVNSLYNLETLCAIFGRDHYSALEAGFNKDEYMRKVKPLVRKMVNDGNDFPESYLPK